MPETHTRGTRGISRSDKISCFAMGVFVMLGSVAITGTAVAQSTPPPAVQSEVIVPIEILIETINGEVRCDPPRARLPAFNPVEIEVTNRAEVPVMFFAPDFFVSAQIVETSGYALEILEGGFKVERESAVRVTMQTPSAGEYGYACHEPGDLPTLESTGFFVVIPSPPET